MPSAENFGSQFEHIIGGNFSEAESYRLRRAPSITPSTPEEQLQHHAATRVVNLNDYHDLHAHLTGPAHNMAHDINYISRFSPKEYGDGTSSPGNAHLLEKPIPHELVEHMKSGANPFSPAFAGGAHPLDRKLTLKELNNVHDEVHRNGGFSSATKDHKVYDSNTFHSTYTTVGNKHWHHESDREDWR